MSDLTLSRNAPFDLAPLAAILTDRDDLALVNPNAKQPFDPAGLVEAGMDVGSKRVLVLKSTHHFYAGFNHEDAQIIYCDAPGTLNSDVSQRPYARITRPIWPLDDIDSIDVRTPMLAK